jgi:dipeptidyl aminopeptidase/acylaminoacyl peptidase
MRDTLQKEQPFVDDRLALVGHSAGGLVTRGLITLPDYYGYTPRATSRC